MGYNREMKAILGSFVLITVLAILGNSILTQFRSRIDWALSVQPAIQTPPPTPLPSAQKTQNTYLFVPYWALSGEDTAIDAKQKTLIYFGVAANEDGVRTDEEGYRNLKTFIKYAGEKPLLLTVRMLDSTTNFSILKNKKAQEKIITQSIALAKKENFEGIVLNFELSALPFDSIFRQIKDFNSAFYQKTKESDLSYFVTSYGDSFYRVRPFDVGELARESNGVFIMAYDLHKAKSNPGPNFPLLGADTYGYDLEKMLTHYRKVVPAEKITVVFGMYGYDWEVDDKGAMTSPGEPKSLKKMQAEFITKCEYNECNVKRNNEASEMNVIYTTQSGIEHRVWFDDEESVKRKEAFFNKNGISSFAYWAHSYF